MTSKTSSLPQPNPSPFDFDDDDEEGWQEMPVVREDAFASGLDDEDRKKYHYVASAKDPEAGGSGANATGKMIDVDGLGRDWRSKAELKESEYTRLRINEEDDADEVHLRTKYLFDEDKAMTPLSQMQATKNLLTEAQRIAYVGVCALTSREMSRSLEAVRRKELKPAVQSMELWAMKIMGRLYYHMELENQEQKMIDSLAEHGVTAMDLVPSLLTTRTVTNPEYDPLEARRQAEDKATESQGQTHPANAQPAHGPDPRTPTTPTFQTTEKILPETTPMPGITTALSTADKDVTLDIRWTVLCDLFLVLIADSVYDARSRVLLENVALKLGLGWLDVVKFESRVTEALEIQEGVERLESQDLIEGRNKAAKKKRYVMMGLATLGGGLVIGLSAGLLAPVIGVGLGAAFTTIGIGGTTGFLAGAGGVAVITTGGVLTGSGIAARGMAHRTQQVRTFDILPLHNNKRVNCILTVPGFMTGMNDDVRLPFSVLDPIVGDVFSVLWEPEMIRETGDALKILTSEVLTQLGQTVLQATLMATLMTALQWPIILTKLGYLIDNPWNNALDRARAAGSVLADVLMQRHLGVRPITLIGFSLGSRVIFYALLELAKHKAFGIVQDVIILGTTLTASTKSWCEARSVVSGRFINGFARNDWVLNYLFRATSGGVGTVAGLHPIVNVPGLENVDVTDKIAGHMSYRAFLPLILDQLGFPVTADHFNEPEEPDFKEDRIVVRDEDMPQKKGWFSRKKKSSSGASAAQVSRPPSSAPGHSRRKATSGTPIVDDDLPPRMENDTPTSPSGAVEPQPERPSNDIPAQAGFDLSAMKEILGNAKQHPEELKIPVPGQATNYPEPPSPPPSYRSGSAPPLDHEYSPATKPVVKSSLQVPSEASDADLRTAFQRSVSVDDVRTDPERVISSNPYQSLRSASTSHRPTPLTSGYNAPWTSEPLSNDTSQVFGHRSFAPSTETLSFGSQNGSIAPFGNPFSTPISQNPFASPADFTSPSSGGLSFGSTDGSITLSPTSNGVEQDPWNYRPPRSSSFNSNPWET